MTVTINGTTGITTPDLTSADDITANGSTVLTAATSPAALPLAGGTLTGNVNLGDNVKAIFGAGSDLEIYHDGTNNRLTLASANTYIQTDGIVHFTDIGNNEKHLTINDDGAVQLYHNNAEKLATTATGIDVTGGAYLLNTASPITMTLQGNTGSVAGIRFQAEEVHGDIQGINSGNNFGGLAFSTNYNGTVAEKVRIDPTGNLILDPDKVGAKYLVLDTSVAGDGHLLFNRDGANKYQITSHPSGYLTIYNYAAGSESFRISTTGVISGNGSGLTGVTPPTTFGAVGTYIWGRPANLTDYAAGATASSLYATSNKHPDTPPYYTSYGGWDSAITVPTSVSGTWRCMAGTGKYNANYAPSSLWVRIS